MSLTSSLFGIWHASEKQVLRSAQDDKFYVHHVCKTPTLNSGTSEFSDAASSACVIACRVSMGSIILSIHNRAAPYRGSVCSSYVVLLESKSSFLSSSLNFLPLRSICFTLISTSVPAAASPLITAYFAVGHAKTKRGSKALPHIA